MQAFHAIAAAEAAGLKIKVDGKRLRVDGDRSLASLAKPVLAQKDAVIDEMRLRSLGVGRHAPETNLGRLTRNLLKWLDGEMIQADDGSKVDAPGMASQIVAKCATLEGPEPDAELRAMVELFRWITLQHEWSWKSKDCDWPEIVDTISAKDEGPNTGKEKPGKDWTKKGGKYVEGEWKSDYELMEVREGVDIPF